MTQLPQTANNEAIQRIMNRFPSSIKNTDIQTIKNLVEFESNDNFDINAKYTSITCHVNTLLHWASGYGKCESERVRLDFVKYLVENGADVNCVVRGNATPLHMASYYDCHDDVIQYLVESGANINAVDSDNGTVLIHAGKHLVHDCLPIVKYLLDHGADKSICFNMPCGQNAAQIARKSCNHDVAQYIESYEYIPTKGVQVG